MLLVEPHPHNYPFGMVSSFFFLYFDSHIFFRGFQIDSGHVTILGIYFLYFRDLTFLLVLGQ